MNQTFDMSLNIKPVAPQPKKPAANKSEKPANDSEFHKTMKDVASSKQPQNQVESGKTDSSKLEPQFEESMVPQEDTVDLQNVAAMMAATMMPMIVMPEQVEVQQPVSVAEAPIQMVVAETPVLTPVEIQQPTVQAMPAQQQQQQVQPQVEEQQIQPAEVQIQTQSQSAQTVDQQQIGEKSAQPQVSKVQEGQDKNAAVVTDAGAAAHSARPLFERVEATPIQVAEPVRADQPEFPVQIADKISKAVNQGANTIEVQLTPYELGKITIRLTMTEEGTQISMHSANAKTIRLLTEHAANIGAVVEHNQPGTVSVTVEQDQPNAQQQQQYAQQEHQGNGQQQQQQGNRHAPAQNDDFVQQLRLGLASLS